MEAIRPCVQAPAISIAFLKYDTAPCMRSSAFPPLHKNRLMKSVYMHDP